MLKLMSKGNEKRDERDTWGASIVKKVGVSFPTPRGHTQVRVSGTPFPFPSPPPPPCMADHMCIHVTLVPKKRKRRDERELSREQKDLTNKLEKEYIF